MNFIIILFLLPLSSFAGEEGMKDMPILKPKQIITVKGNEDFDSQKGFGDQEPQIKMKNLMMVGGSGMEEMAMEDPAKNLKIRRPSPHTHFHAVTNYTFEIKTPKHIKVGTNDIEIKIKDENSHQLVGNLHLKSEVSMTTMDMGTETPMVKEKSTGNYQVKVPFSMKGVWAVKIIFPDGFTKVFEMDVK